MEAEREKARLMGQAVPEQPYFPDAIHIKSEPLDHDDDATYGMLSNQDAMPAAGSFYQSEVQRSVEDVVKLHRDSTKAARAGDVAAAQQSRRKTTPVTSRRTSATNKLGRCSVCGKEFNLKVLLIRHMKSHSNPRLNLKSQKLGSTVQKQKPSKQNTTKKLALGTMRRPSVLRRLFRSGHVHNQSKPVVGVTSSSSSCFVCQKWFSYKAVFKLHMLKTHPVSGSKPNIYDSSYSVPTALAGSQSFGGSGSRTTKEKKYKCPLCDKSFTQSGKLSSHKKKHTGEKPFHCSVCGKDFALKDHLNIHIKIHTGEKPYPCTLCDKAFRQGGHLRMHMQTHTGIKPHKCDFCDKAFSQKGSLMSHMRTHTGEKLQHQCSMCDKSFRDSTKLNNHVRTHTGEKPFQCSLCDKAFSQSGDLVRHMRTHTGEKPYVCTVCNKQFSEGSNLNKHMRTHTGYKPHECSICHKSFSEGSTLKNHMRIHSGEKPYQCSVCQKEFIQSGDLYKHMRTHTGEKPHNCPQCGRAFTESSTLRKHMKTHKTDGEEDMGYVGRGRGGGRGNGGSLQPRNIKNESYGGLNPQGDGFDGMDYQNVNFNANLASQGTDFGAPGSQSVNHDYDNAESQNVNFEHGLYSSSAYNYKPDNVHFHSFKPLNRD